MSDTLALEKLYADVQARFALDGTIAEQPFGWRPTSQQRLMPRIVWTPGDDKSGELGRIDPARNPGRNPRPLGTLLEIFTCVISAQDPSDPENEFLQYKATRLLFDAWFRAVYLASVGTYSIVRANWLKVGAVTQRRFGTGLRVLGTIQAMIPDVELLGIPVGDATVIVDLSLLNVTETQTIVAAPVVDPFNEAPQ
jgi:hypothetical protein